MSRDDDESELSGWERSIDNTVRDLWQLAKPVLCPPLYLYGGVEDTADQCLKRGLWLYATFFVFTIPLFWNSLMTGEYELLGAFPVYHLVVTGALIATVAPTMLTGVSVEWPAMLVAPEFFPDAPALAALTLAPVVVGLVGAYASTWVVPDDKIAVPMAETYRKSDGADNRPLFERDVSTLLSGETGAGKSSAMQLLAYQYEYGNEIATFAHDLKRDFLEFFTTEGELATEVERISIEGGTVVWNLFLDVEKPRQFNEVAKGVMGEPQGKNPFHRPATQVLADSMIYLHQEGAELGETPTHADLLTFLREGPEHVYESLDDADLPAATSLDPEAGGSKNTYQTMMENVREVFVGDFAKAGDFSLREYIENPDGRVVTINTPSDEVETVGPMYRLLLDMSIKYGMTSETEVNYLLDEVDELPRMSRLSALASAGRGEGVRALIGIQSIGQLRAVYGDAVDGILGNCPQGIYFGPGEHGTVQYVLHELGKLRETVVSKTTSSSESQHGSRSSTSETEREVERSPIPSGELKKFDPGESVVKNRSNWWIGRVAELDDVRENLDVQKEDS